MAEGKGAVLVKEVESTMKDLKCRLNWGIKGDAGFLHRYFTHRAQCPLCHFSVKTDNVRRVPKKNSRRLGIL